MLSHYFRFLKTRRTHSLRNRTLILPTSTILSSTFRISQITKVIARGCWKSRIAQTDLHICKPGRVISLDRVFFLFNSQGLHFLISHMKEEQCVKDEDKTMKDKSIDFCCLTSFSLLYFVSFLYLCVETRPNESKIRRRVI